MNPNVTALACPDDDQHSVEAFERKLQLIRDRVASVAHGYHTGCYLVGRPGTSKTFTVMAELESLGCPQIYKNARMTPWGLFCTIADCPEHVIILDDITSLFKSDQAMETLLAALDGTPGQPRTVMYRSKDHNQQAQFSGAIVAISNVPMRCDPLARALGSRIVVLEHEPSDQEVTAFVRHLAAMGFMDLDAPECLEVADFIIAETRQHNLRLDLRHLTKAWQDYRQFKHGRALTPWKDLIRTSLQKAAREPAVPLSKREDIELQRHRVREASEKFPDDRKAQIQASGLKPSTFYNRLKEVESDQEAA